jgi:hypothetical protein
MDLDAQHSRRAVDVIARFRQAADIADPKLACAADPRRSLRSPDLH